MYASTYSTLGCDADDILRRDEIGPNVGFRCCSDAE